MAITSIIIVGEWACVKLFFKKIENLLKIVLKSADISAIMVQDEDIVPS